MKTEVKQLHLSEVGLQSNVELLDQIDSESRLVKAWNGDYIETLLSVNGNNLKLITKLSGLSKTLSSTYYLLHPVYQEYERYYLGDSIITKGSDKIFTESELLHHHQLNFAKLLEYEKRRYII